MKHEIRSRMRGGSGEISITHIVDPDQIPQGRLLADIIIPSESSIGEHPHDGETEYYIILEGQGVVCDNGTDQNVKAGDVVITPHGSQHSIRNTGDSPLRMIALILND